MLRVVNATRRRLTEAVNWYLPQQRPEEVDRVAMELRVFFDLWQVANRVEILWPLHVNMKSYGRIFRQIHALEGFTESGFVRIGQYVLSIKRQCTRMFGSMIIRSCQLMFELCLIERIEQST